VTDLDVVIFGATGYTGALTAGYLATNAPAGLRWGVAGRSKERLTGLRDQLQRAGCGNEPTIIEADIDDPSSMRALAESTRVLASTVGPYLRYGEPAVSACAQAGTDYLDITGEAEFVDQTYLRHHATAERTGARLVHACGFDSIPHDLGAQFAVEQLPADQPIRLRGYVSARSSVSGGTVESAMTALARSRQAAQLHAERRRVEPRPTDRSARARPGKVRRVAEVGAWVLPFPTVDPQIIARSARALPDYGPDFTYSHYWVAGNAVRATALSGAIAAAFLLAKLPPARALVRRLHPAGAGASEQQRARGWFRVLFCGEAGEPDRPGERVLAEVRGGEPGYAETSKMLAESALCLALDKLPVTAGQVTTAVAMGDVLRERLEQAGITFRVLT